jgi:hypothetical protein
MKKTKVPKIETGMASTGIRVERRTLKKQKNY